MSTLIRQECHAQESFWYLKICVTRQSAAQKVNIMFFQSQTPGNANIKRWISKLLQNHNCPQMFVR